MTRNDLNKGIILVLAGLCFILAAVLSESVFDGLLWGFAGGALGIGIAMIFKYFYWSAPQNKERYQKILEQKDIELHDELNEKLRDRSGRIAYLAGLVLICISEVVFCFLGKMGIITDHKIIVMYLFGLFAVQIVIGSFSYYQLKKKY